MTLCWDSASGKESARVQLRDIEAGDPPQLALSPDGTRLAVSYTRFDKDAFKRVTHWQLFDIPGGKQLADATTEQHGGQPVLAFSPDGTQFAGAASYFLENATDQVVQLRDPASGAELTRLVVRTERATTTALVFAPDGRTVVLASHPLTHNGSPDTARAATIHIWELASGGLRQQFHGHQGPIQSLAFAADGTLLASGATDTTILVWDTSGRPKAPATLSAQELDEAWTALAAPDALAAYRALGRLLGAPGQAMSLLKMNLRPVPALALDEAKIPHWLADLDSPAFARREVASRSLEQFGRRAVPALRQAHQEAATLEVRRRVADLLERIQNKVLALRDARALEVLERLSGREAEALLAELARGAPAAPLTEEAAKVLVRRR
jgi:hypothetical protein